MYSVLRTELFFTQHMLCTSLYTRFHLTRRQHEAYWSVAGCMRGPKRSDLSNNSMVPSITFWIGKGKRKREKNSPTRPPTPHELHCTSRYKQVLFLPRILRSPQKCAHRQTSTWTPAATTGWDPLMRSRERTGTEGCRVSLRSWKPAVARPSPFPNNFHFFQVLHYTYCGLIPTYLMASVLSLSACCRSTCLCSPQSS